MLVAVMWFRMLDIKHAVEQRGDDVVVVPDVADVKTRVASVEQAARLTIVVFGDDASSCVPVESGSNSK